MKNKGFTLVELITTFALASVIIVLLINVVVIIKEVYSNTNIKTELYINQSNLSNALNSKISQKNSVLRHECLELSADFLLDCRFDLKNAEYFELKVSEKQIKFGNYTYNLDEKSKVINPSYTDYYDDFFVIKIPIKNELYPDIDFGVNLVYLY